MTPAACLETLQSRGVELFLGSAGDLRFRAPVGVLTDRVREALRENRPALTAYLREKERHNLTGSARDQRTMPAAKCDDGLVSGLIRLGDFTPLQGTPGERYLSGRGLPAHFCQGAGVRFQPDFFGHPAVLFPLQNKAGELIAVQGRYTDGFDKPTARTVGPKKLGVFATPGALDPALPFLCVTEDPLDALTLALCGVPAIALGGYDGIPDWLKAHCAFQTVLVAFDADEDGDKAAGVLELVLRGVGADVQRLRSDYGNDWNAVLMEHGVPWLRAYLLPGVFPCPEVPAAAAMAEMEVETSASPHINGLLLPDEGKAARLAALVAEFGEDLVRQHILLPFLLFIKQWEAVAEEHGEVVLAACQAATHGFMPRIPLGLGPGRWTVDPAESLILLVLRASLMQAAHGDRWRDWPQGEQIASDIDVIAGMYQNWYWLHQEGRTLLAERMLSVARDAAEDLPEE